MLVGVHIIYVCFCPQRQSCAMVTEAVWLVKPKIYLLALYRKSMPTPNLNQHKHTIVERAKRRGRRARSRKNWENQPHQGNQRRLPGKVMLELQSELIGNSGKEGQDGAPSSGNSKDSATEVTL